MTKHEDAVDAVIEAFLDYLEGAGIRPTLDHLTEEDRRRAEALMQAMEAGRGIDPHASRPPVEALLAGTRLTGLLTADGTLPGVADLATVRDVLAGVDNRAQVAIDPAGAQGTVVYCYLDFRARFMLVDSETLAITGGTQAMVAALFDQDGDVARVGVVAARSTELLTVMLSSDDVGSTVTTPRGEPHVPSEPPLPLTLAARRMIEQCAPEWQPFDFDSALLRHPDVHAIAAETAARVIGREAARSYRGDKARAYRALAGRENLFAGLAAKVSAPGAQAVDYAEETDRIARTAA